MKNIQIGPYNLFQKGKLSDCKSVKTSLLGGMGSLRNTKQAEFENGPCNR